MENIKPFSANIRNKRAGWPCSQHCFIFTKYFSIYVQYLLKSIARTQGKEKNNKEQKFEKKYFIIYINSSLKPGSITNDDPK